MCQGQHITLMHSLTQESPVHVTQDPENKLSTVLPTAAVKIMDLTGCGFKVRCLFDLCAERSYVCESIVQLLRLKKYKSNLRICGINGLTGRCSSFVNLMIQISNNPKTELIIEALVVPKITGLLPSTPKIENLDQAAFMLADSPCNERKYIGVLVGGDIATKLYVLGVPNHITPAGYLRQPTHLGWIISGSSNSQRKHVSTFVTINETSEKLYQDEELTKRILAFYELPEPEFNGSDIDDYCEKLFTEKHQMEDTSWLFHGKLMHPNLDTLIEKQ